MTDLRLLEVDYTTDPIEGDVARFDGEKWAPSNSIPAGVMLPYAGSAAPTGYLLCDGSVKNRTDYAALFTAIGTTFNTGGEAGTQFRLPDTRQKFLLGKAASGTGNTLGGTGGAIDHTHSVPAHYHGMGTGADLNITASGSHSHNLDSSNRALYSGFNAGSGAQGVPTSQESATQAATHTHASGNFAGKIGLVTGGVDGNASMTSGTNNPPYLVVNHIIKT